MSGKYVELSPEDLQFLERFAKMVSGEGDECVRCGAHVDQLEQVGRCVYARPCGCRQYQGKVPRRKDIDG